MNSIEYVKQEIKKSKDFEVKDIDSFKEFFETKSKLEQMSQNLFPFYGFHSYENGHENKINIFFDNDCEYNQTVCSSVFSNEKCTDFIIEATLKKFWSNLSIPEKIRPEGYEKEPWMYDVEVRFGNCSISEESGEFVSTYKNAQNENKSFDSKLKTIAVLPCLISFTRQEKPYEKGQILKEYEEKNNT